MVEVQRIRIYSDDGSSAMSTLERAIEIAASAHTGQADKAGAPYMGMSRPLLKFGGGSVEILRDVLH